MRRTISGALAPIFIIALVGPAGLLTRAHADQRCTPIAHVFDATTLPGNGSSDPNSQNPNDRYHDQLGLNCIPTYELNFNGALGGTLPSDVYHPARCDPESAYDQVARAIAEDPNFYKACTRLEFTFGPILARPGMSDSLIQVQTFEHPMYDGYTLRWKPGLQLVDGSVPKVEDLHLHHGTWIGGVNGPTAVTGPFFATGEEQTILQFPKGYGWTMQGQSAWLMLYMIHNATQQAKAVYITYDIDYIASADAANLHWVDGNGTTRSGLEDVQSIWMDAGAGGPQFTWEGMKQDKTSPTTNVYSGLNPIFNAQRGFGHLDDGAFHDFYGPAVATNPLYNPDNTGLTIRNNEGTGQLICTYPFENCAGQDSSQHQSLQQGIPTDKIIGHATQLADSAFQDCPQLGVGKKCAVLINMGGHLHPGGLRDEVMVQRGNVMRPVLVSDAVYWGGSNYAQPQIAGAPPISWDLSMTGQLGGSAETGRAKDAWKILIQPGDKLMLNGVYDTQVGSAYDQMAIVMSWVHPGFEPDAIDPFNPDTIFDAGWEAGPNLTPRPSGLPAAIDHPCTPGTIRAGDADAGANGEFVGKTVLCLRGNVTHGSMPSRQDHAICQNCTPLTTSTAMPLASTTITMQDFSYGQLDQAFAGVFGVTKIPRGTTLTFYNPDTAGMIWHTITSCAAPCNGSTSASYPYPATEGTPVDFDSTILCVGLGCSTNGTTTWTWTVPGTPGLYTFFCRIHPSMRGAFEVT